VMAEQAHTDNGNGLGDQARALREDLAPARLKRELEEALEEQPMARQLLSIEIVLRAAAVAAVVALLLWLIVGARAAAIALVVVFLGTWLVWSRVSYDRRRRTQPADGEESEDDRKSEGDDQKSEGESRQRVAAP
jgi:Flp pilus assembly protein TadB